MKKIKEQQLLQKKKDKEREELKSLIKSKLTQKYKSILDETEKFEKFVLNKNTWKISRENLTKSRKKIFNTIYNERITYENIFLNEKNKTSAFTLSEYMSYYSLDYKNLLAKTNQRNKGNLQENDNLTIQSINENKNLIENYHESNNSDLQKENINNNLIDKETLIDVALREMEIEDSNIFNKKALVKNILVENHIDNDIISHKENFNQELNFNSADKLSLIITDENTKIINNPHIGNEILMYDYIKNNFVLNLIEKVIIQTSIIKKEKKEKMTKIKEGIFN